VTPLIPMNRAGQKPRYNRRIWSGAIPSNRADP
jgi:hypothetical protein